MTFLLPDEDPENKFRYNKRRIKMVWKMKNTYGNILTIKKFYMKKISIKMCYFFNPGPT